MNGKEFKGMFARIAKDNGFKAAFGGWYRQSSECIAALALQKSNFGDYYLLLINVFIKGAFGRTYQPDKKLIKSAAGHIMAGETPEYGFLLELDSSLDDGVREKGLQRLFRDHIVPFTNRALSKAGIREMAEEGTIVLLPAVNEELTKMGASPL
jgi:hypothetical protein